MPELYHNDENSSSSKRRKFPPAKPGHKFCRGCEEEKTLEEFHSDRSTPDGYYSLCKVCKKARSPFAGKSRVTTRSEEVRAKRRESKRRKRALMDDRLLNSPAPPIQVTSKICPKCDTERPIDEFSINSRKRNGHGSWCKTCTGAYHSQGHMRARRKEREQERGEDFKREKYAGSLRWRRANIDALRVQWREKYATDPAYAKRMRNHSRKWIKNHPLEMQAHQLRRIAAIKGAEVVEDIDLKQILKRDGRHCYICNQAILPHQKLVFDHVIPLIPRAGNPRGTHTADNIKPAHNECNGRKSNRRFEDLTEFDRRGPDTV